MDRAAAIWKAMAEIVKLRAKQTINNTLHYCNGPNTTLVHNLPLNFEVLVWRKSGNWTKFYHLLAVKDETCRIQFPSGPTSFKSIFIKPYFQSKNTYNVKLDELEAPAKLDKLETPTELNKLKAPLPTPEVP